MKENYDIEDSPCELHCTDEVQDRCAEDVSFCKAFYTYVLYGVFKPCHAGMNMTRKQRGNIKRGLVAL
jgi:hypothetical protein